MHARRRPSSSDNHHRGGTTLIRYVIRTKDGRYVSATQEDTYTHDINEAVLYSEHRLAQKLILAHEEAIAVHVTVTEVLSVS